MLIWYQDKHITVSFSDVPRVKERFIIPGMDEDIKKSIKRYPYKNCCNLTVLVEDHKKNKVYEFTIVKGYCFDGASIPGWILKVVIGAKTDNKFLIAAMVHDWMCENHEVVGHDRNLSSRVFKGLLLTGGTSKFKSQLMYLGVDNFQRFQKWNPKNKKKRSDK